MLQVLREIENFFRKSDFQKVINLVDVKKNNISFNDTDLEEKIQVYYFYSKSPHYLRKTEQPIMIKLF